ncbi:MAG: hypothetical protein R3Y64_07890 [Peptostreptococcaceae bacterium]
MNNKMAKALALTLQQTSALISVVEGMNQVKNPSKSEIITDDLTEENQVIVNDFIDKVILAEQEKDLDLLNEVLSDLFAFTPTSNREEALKLLDKDKEFLNMGEIDYVLKKAIYIGLTINEGEARNKFLIDFIDDLYISSVNRENAMIDGSIHRDTINYLFNEVRHLFDGNLKEDDYTYTSYELVWSIKMLHTMENHHGMPGAYPDESPDDHDPDYIIPLDVLPSTNMPSTVPPSLIPDDLGYVMPELPNSGSGGYTGEDYTDAWNDWYNEWYGNNKDTENGSSSSYGFSESKYTNKGGTYYNVITYYDRDGNKIDEKDYTTSNFQCGIYGYSFEDGESYVSRIPTISQLNSVGASSSGSSSLNTNIQNNVDIEIIYFTLNKTDLVPYYYQTSISVTGETISYNTVVSIFKQIASGINGYVVEDKERIMFIGEGKPIIIKENKDGYLKDEVINIFNLKK